MSRADNLAPSGSTLLAKSKANPGSIDKSIFQPKSAPVGQGAVSSDYLEKTRADNPEPDDKQKDSAPPVLSNCRFVTPVEELRAQEEFDMAVDVKIPAGSSAPAQATFTLFCFVPQSGTEAGSGKEERSKTWTVEGKVDGAGGDPVVVKARRTLMPELGTAPGGKTAFELEATHPDLQEPCKSPRVEVILKTVAHWVGGDDLHFRTDGEFPLLGADGALLQVLATAVGRIQKPAQEGETVICFGFASSAGGADANRALSLRRAQVVKALLDRDESGWSTLAKSNFETLDLQQFLSDLHAACGWECDPGAVDGVDGPKTKAAITSFQEECNARYGLGLKADGVCGPKTWGAVHRAILGQVQDVLGEDSAKAPAWPKPKWGAGGEGVYGNGEDFATGGDKPEERSVQITFLAPGAEQPLKKAPTGQKATPKENPHQDEKLVEKKKVDKSGEVKKGQPTKPDLSNLRWETAEAWEGTEAKLVADTTLKDGSKAKVLILSEGRTLLEGTPKVSAGKLAFDWTVCDCGFESRDGNGIPNEVNVSAKIEVEGKSYSTKQDLLARFVCETNWETFSKDFTWNGFTVHSEFKQRVRKYSIQANAHSKIVKSWGGYKVWMSRAKITGRVADGPESGCRWGRVIGTGVVPNQYHDGSNWVPMPSGFIPKDSEYSTFPFVPLESNIIKEFFVGRKYGLKGSSSQVWPDTFADYSYDDPRFKSVRDTWISVANSKFSGRFKIRSQGCCQQCTKQGGGHPFKFEWTIERIEQFQAHTIGFCPGNMRSNAGTFFYGDSRPALAAHEVGHLVGLPDEYVGGGIDPTVQGDGATAGIDPSTLMGQSLGVVKKRHFVNFLAMAKLLAEKKSGKAVEYVAA